MLGFNDHEVGDPVRVAAAQESVWLKALYESNRELIHGDMAVVGECFKYSSLLLWRLSLVLPQSTE